MKCPVCGKDYYNLTDMGCGHTPADLFKEIGRLKEEKLMLEEEILIRDKEIEGLKDEKSDLQVRVRRWKRQYEAVKQEYREYREDSK